MKPVNLIPQQHRAGASGDGRRAHFFLGGLAVLVIAVLAYGLTLNSINSKKTEIAQAKQETQAAEARVKELGDFASFAAVKQARLESVRQLAGKRFDWERTIREISRVLPKDVWLDEVAAAGAPAGSSGVPSTAAGAPTGANVKLRGCAPSQPDVATLMVRLRRLHLAADVKLTSSEKSDVAQGGEPTGDKAECGDYAFEVTVEFADAAAAGKDGDRKVPASLGGGS